jgi:hypothetical protein
MHSQSRHELSSSSLFREATPQFAGFAICTSRAIGLLGSYSAQLARIVLFLHVETLPASARGHQ